MSTNVRILPVATPILGNNIASTSASASTAADLFGEYDIFLSFCGKDTRYGFTDFLYTYLHDAGVRTFRDDNELRVGEEIGTELLKAIKDSKISIPVFSKNYASSKWCLIELAQIVQCQAEGEQMIFPIFYDVDPHDVRNQSSSYEKAFHEHRRKDFSEKTIQIWKEALTKVGQLKGLELQKETGGREGELVKIIVEKVLNYLKKNNYHESKNFVGMENHMKKMKGLLNSDFHGVRIIGIHGMGGLGKTTIAKTIYNQLFELFESHCFLADVRENSRSRTGMVDLQNQLLSKLMKTNMSNVDDVNEGINKIKDAVREKKVLIIIDDVDEKSQIDKLAGSYRWFGAGSRILITTRNEDVLCVIEQTCLGEGQLDVYRSYNPELMDDYHSLMLFSKYAFASDYPPEDYGILSKEVVSTAAGLPLVIVTLGSSFFCEKDEDLWKEKLKKLKQVPHKEVLEKLRLSFDPLDDGEKQIFLDIACFFIGEDKRNPCYMWDDCKFYPRNGLKVLVRRSLITVGDDNTLRMHDQLRDLGRKIVCEGNLYEPGRWSRIWRNDDALDIFETRKITNNVEALGLNFTDFRGSGNRACLAGNDFCKLQNIRYLTLDRADLDGDFEFLLSNLRWLRWSGLSRKSMPRNLHLKNLVILNVSNSDFSADWDVWSQIKRSKKLKVLFISAFTSLSRTPYLSTYSNLEWLEISNCSSLSSLDGIEELESLIYLRITNCQSLERLPNLSKLSKLEELDVSCCWILIDIPGLDKLESLELLQITQCDALKRLPNLSNLKKLKILDAAGCRKIIRIEGLGALESLERLDVTWHECKTLSGLSNLKRLKELNTVCCMDLTEIHGLEGLGSLEHLNMSKCDSLKRLPDLSNLKSLQILNISNCKQIVEIQGLQRLESLELLNISVCKLIEKLPDLSALKRLKEIYANDCEKLTEIRGIEKLESLMDVYVVRCKSLTKLRHFPNTKIHQRPSKLEEELIARYCPSR